MSFTYWNAPNVKYNTLEMQKLSSTLDSITTKKMYANQMLYRQAVIFQPNFLFTCKIHTDSIDTPRQHRHGKN